MRKLMFVIGFLGLGLSSFAQRNSGYDRDRDYDRYDGRNSSYDRRDNNWGYDANWNRINGGGRGGMFVNSFQRQSRDRIAEGISRGLITGREAKKLLTFAEEIERKENRYMRNGRLTQREANELTADLNALNRMITRETRDRDRLNNDDRRYRRF